MILMSAIANITSNLDLIKQQEVKTISSHARLKEEALDCLAKLIEQAPINEYKIMLASKNCDILIGYLMSMLCHFAKNDKSRVVRLRSLEVMSIMLKRLGHHHTHGYSLDKCAISSLIMALPGVSSTLFKIIMSDTKLNHKILVMAIRNLSDLLNICFLECHHESVQEGEMTTGVYATKLEGTLLGETCDNLAVRIRILLEYSMNNSQELHPDVRREVINFVTSLIKCHRNLLNHLFKIIIRYIASLKSVVDYENDHNRIQKATNILVTELENQVRSKGQGSPDIDLDITLINCLTETLDNLERHALDMLLQERNTELAAFNGFLEILSSPSLTIFLGVPHRRDQFFKILIQLSKFSTHHPLLLLTDTRIGEHALEIRNERTYTMEKQFCHLTEREVILVRDCCQLVGCKTSWSILIDVLRHELFDFENPSKLFLAYHILEGLHKRTDLTEFSRFASQALYIYINRIQEGIVAINAKLDDTYSSDVLKTVIAIETMELIVGLNLKCHTSEQLDCNTIILRDLLCPLLNWCSSKARAISETSLSTLTKVGHLYGYESTKDFIHQFTDYIVDGVSQMLDNFASNPEVTHVLAVTFKLSSVEVFYYFKDVYERMFKLLEAYHYTNHSKFIALLFYRTLSILNDWIDAKQRQSDRRIASERIPLKSESSIKAVIRDIDINLKIEKLKRDRKQTEKVRNQMESLQVNAAENEENIKQEMENPDVRMDKEEKDDACRDYTVIVKKKDEIFLTEKIMKHCVGLTSSGYSETKILALKTASLGFRILREDEDTLLPIVHQLWPPLISRLTSDYNQNLEINLCAFECLATMATYSKDFIKRRTLDSVIPKICLFLESQSNQSKGKKECEPYCMTMAFKSQLRLLTHLGPLAYNVQLAYNNLWRVIRVALLYLEQSQVPSLREAARSSLHFMIALDADCVWYYAKQTNHLGDLPFGLIYESF